MDTNYLSFEQKTWGICLIMAQALMALSTFFWQGQEYGINAGTVITLSSVFWIPGMIALFSLVKKQQPVYATLGLLVAIYGCIGGALFGFEGLYTAIYQISQDMARQGWAQYPLQVNLTLFWPGPLFPLSLLVLALVYWRTHAVPLWVAGLLGVGAVAFPLSRIVRIEWIAHLVDLALLIPACYVAWRLFTRKPAVAQV